MLNMIVQWQISLITLFPPLKRPLVTRHSWRKTSDNNKIGCNLTKVLSQLWSHLLLV